MLRRKDFVTFQTGTKPGFYGKNLALKRIGMRFSRSGSVPPKQQ